MGGALTGNKQIEIPAETALTFTLSKSISPSDCSGASASAVIRFVVRIS